MKKGKFTIFFTLLAVLFSTAVYAGSLDSTAAPGATGSYTLEDIYNRLGGSALPAQSTFTEPGTAAGTGTGHTLNEVMARIDARFTDNGDGTVTDSLTRLMWVKNANAIGTLHTAFDTDSTAGDGRVTWQHALDFVAAVNAGTYNCGVTASYNDWRLPNVRELYSLIDLSKYNPALPAGHPFTGVQSSYYWTGTTYLYYTSFAWYVGLDHGGVYYFDKTGTFYVWPVRGGQ